MDITKFKPAIVYTIYIASTPQKVWQALTSAEFSRKYFSGFAIEADLKVGGAFIARAPDGSAHIGGEVIECDPPKRLTVTWNVNWPDLVEKLGPTLVTYEIEPAGENVKLTMLQSHDRPISDDILSGGRSGWPAILSNLKSLLETGNAMTIPMKPPQRMLDALKAMGIKDLTADQYPVVILDADTRGLEPAGETSFAGRDVQLAGVYLLDRGARALRPFDERPKDLVGIAVLHSRAAVYCEYLHVVHSCRLLH